MPGKLTLYTNPMSRGRIARWMLEEVGEPYDTVVLAYGEGMKSPAYLAINPMGKVPAITHGSRTVTEGAAICAYLADAFPQAGLAPALDDRADYYRWLFFTAGPLEAAVINHSVGWDPNADLSRTFGYGTYDAAVGALEALLTAQAYVTGEDFTAADVYVGAAVNWGLGFGTLPKRPAFEAYAARVTSRPAYLRATALDDALLPPKEPK